MDPVHRLIPLAANNSDDPYVLRDQAAAPGSGSCRSPTGDLLHRHVHRHHAAHRRRIRDRRVELPDRTLLLGPPLAIALFAPISVSAAVQANHSLFAFALTPGRRLDEVVGACHKPRTGRAGEGGGNLVGSAAWLDPIDQAHQPDGAATSVWA